MDNEEGEHSADEGKVLMDKNVQVDFFRYRKSSNN